MFEPLICQPIGIIHTAMRLKFDAPHQPTDGVNEQNVIELFDGHKFEQALQDLAGFERIWLIWWFDRNPNWRTRVIPPRGTHKRRGVFATRSPHRPCPIGMTAVPLLSINGRKLVVGNVDLLDKTPILDIKPYISSVDSFQNQRQGWLDEEEAELSKPIRYKVELSELAAKQADYLQSKWGVSFFDKCKSILERSPERSRTNRITSAKMGVARMSSGVWRLYFSVEGEKVKILRIAPGYPKDLLFKDGFEVITDWQAQRAFLEIWVESE